MEFLFLLGIAYMVMRGWENGAPARNQRRIAAAARPGVNTTAHKRRARRQATLGWWLGEAWHRFPVTREGFRDGWAEHQRHLEKRRASARERDHQHQGWRDAWAEHWRELTTTQEQDQEQTQEAPHMRGENCTNPGCACHASDPPLADGQTPGNGPAQNGHKSTNPGGTPVTTPTETGGTDYNYEQVNATCEQALQEAEAASSVSIEACTQLADGLGGIPKVRENSDLMGKANELSSAARDFERARKRMLDAAQAVKDQNEQDYSGQQDAADASGKALSDYVEH